MLTDIEARDYLLNTLLTQARAIVVADGFQRCKKEVIDQQEMEKLSEVVEHLDAITELLTQGVSIN